MLTALQAGRGNPPEPLLFERRKFLLVFYVRDAHVRVLRDVLCVRRVSRFRLRRLREAADFCAGVLDLPCNYKKREKGSGGHGEALCGPAVLAQRPDGTRC